MPPTGQSSGTEPSDLARAASGSLWTIGWRFASRGLGIVSVAVLARLLTPSDFGIVALATGLAQSLDHLTHLGTEEALIRARDPTPLWDTGFTLSLLRAVAIAVLLLALALPAAQVFADPRLAVVMVALALGALLDGAANIGTVEWRRALRLDLDVRLQLTPRLIGFAVNISVAVILRSYIALVAGLLAQRVAQCAASWLMHPMRPRLSLAAWRVLAPVSLWSWFTALAMLARQRGPVLLVGGIAGAGAAGLFSVATEIAAMPTTELLEPMARAVYPALASGPAEGVRRTWLRVAAVAAIVTLPGGVGIALVAQPLVRLGFGPDWDAAIPALQILALAGSASTFGLFGLTDFLAEGKLRTIFAVTTIAAAARILLLVALIPHTGLIGAALAVAASVVLEDSLAITLALRGGEGGGRSLAGVLWRPTLATVAMALAVPPVLRAFATPLPALLGGTLAGMAAYAAALTLSWLAAGRPRAAETDFLALFHPSSRLGPA